MDTLELTDISKLVADAGPVLPKKRVLVFSLAYAPFIGGAEVAIREIAARLPHYQFTVLTLWFDSTLPKVEQAGNVLIRRIGFSKRKPSMTDLSRFPLSFNKLFFPFTGLREALRLHREQPFDMTWAMMANYAGFAALFFKMLRPKVPYLLTLQEGDPIEYIKHRVRFVYPLFRRIFTRADSVQAISNYLADFARSMGAKAQIEVVPNGVDGKLFSAPVSEAAKKAVLQRLSVSRFFPTKGGQGDDLVVITTSRLVKKNGLIDVINALPLLPEQVKFLVLGVGPDEEMLKSAARSLNLLDFPGRADRVLFLGQAATADIPAYLQLADVFCRPSLSEGLGNSFIEAMAAGLPVVATPVGGIPDFLKDGETGLFCQSENPASVAEAIRRILSDGELCGRLASTGQTLALEQYDWSLVASRMLEIFARLTA